MRSCLVLLGLLASGTIPASSVAQGDSTTALLLARGDTGAALTELRQQAQETDRPECWCVLAELLTSMATMHQASWRGRQESPEGVARAVGGVGDGAWSC